MSYSITVESFFSAAHRLKGYKGKCENMHGHNWKVHVTILSDRLDKTGMVFDFTDAKAILKNILSKLDHKQLDKVEYFKRQNPTSERISEFIFKAFEKKVKAPMTVESVKVWETPTSCATYRHCE